MLEPLQITKGGPIIMAQVENEYGSYGSDKDYVKSIWTLSGRNFRELFPSRRTARTTG